MMPFTFLWLPNPVDEAAFARRYAAKYFASRDLLFRAIRACISPVYMLIRLWQHGLGAPGLTAMLTVFLTIAVEGMGFNWQRDRWGGKRTTMAVVTRIVIIVTQTMDALATSFAVRTPGSMFRFMIMQSGLVALILCNIGVPLLVKHHLAVNVAAFVVMGMFTVPHMCAVAVSDPESGPIFLAVWRIINAILTGAALENNHVPPPHDACRSVVAMSHFVLGLLVPSYAMWTVEYEDRTDFNAGEDEVLTEATMGKQMLLFIPVMGCMWLFLNFRMWW